MHINMVKLVIKSLTFIFSTFQGEVLFIKKIKGNFILKTRAIQRINGTSLKEHWAAQRNQVYKQQYQQLQHDTGLKYKIEFF